MTSTPKRAICGAPRPPLAPFPPILPMQKNSASQAPNINRKYMDSIVDRDAAFWANRTVLYIDVPHAVHKQIIGPQGANQKKISKETGCHIHLPDANKNPNLAKVNKVQISGLTENVELARQRIRAMEPLVVAFELCSLRDGVIPDPSTIVKEIHYNKVGYKFLNSDPPMRMYPICTVSGLIEGAASIMAACNALSQRLLNPEAVVIYCIWVEIDPVEVRFVLGDDGTPVKSIADKTGVEIIVPSPGYSTFILRGPSVEKVLLARQHLLGLMPVQFYFARPFGFSLINCKEMAKALNLSISVINNCHSFSRSVIIRAHEFRLSDVYAARQRILQLPGTASTCRDYEFMAEMSSSVTMISTNNPILPLFDRGSDSSSTTSGSQPYTFPPYSSSSTSSGTVFNFDHQPSKNGPMSGYLLQAEWMRGAVAEAIGIRFADCSPAPPKNKLNSLRSHRQVTFVGVKGGSQDSLTDSTSCDVVELDNSVNNTPRIPTDKNRGLWMSKSMRLSLTQNTQFSDSTHSREQSEDESLGNEGSLANSFTKSYSSVAMKGILKNASDFAVSNIETGPAVHTDWDPVEFDEPRKVLEKLNMQHLQEKFDEEGIDIVAFVLLNENDFKGHFEVTKLGALRKLMNAVTCLKHNRSLMNIE